VAACNLRHSIRQFSFALLPLSFLNYAFRLRLSDHVRWVPCHNGMVRPQVADGGDGLHIWRVAANILNKQSLTTDWG
jgi:hypothetical protein